MANTPQASRIAAAQVVRTMAVSLTRMDTWQSERISTFTRDGAIMNDPRQHQEFRAEHQAGALRRVWIDQETHVVSFQGELDHSTQGGKPVGVADQEGARSAHGFH